jgi:hypothetical protein
MTEDQPAAIQATFSDVKLIRSRKVCQLVLEIPLEQADAALSTLGGIPQPHSERWVALARLNGYAPEPKPDKEKQRWEDLKLSMQAGIRCSEPAFWEFVRKEVRGARDVRDEATAANWLRWLLGIDSRSGLNDNPAAAERWRDLDRSYQAWLQVLE